MNSVKPAAVRARQVVTPHGILEDTTVYFSRDGIEGIGSRTAQSGTDGTVQSGQYLIPGMIDIHINGSGGGDASGGTRDELEKMSVSLAAHGATAFLPTVITDHSERLVEVLERLSGVLSERYSGALPLGIHLEGPFLNPEKRGAHKVDCIQAPTPEAFKRFRDAASGALKMLTLAPEQDGALKVIEEARKSLPIVSLGHSMATYEQAREGIRAGANAATHLFNAMPPSPPQGAGSGGGRAGK